MADEQRQTGGSPSDRKFTTLQAIATGTAGGLTIGICDWLVQCFQAGHIVAPSQQLIEVGSPIIVLPVGLWFGRVFSLIGDIVIKKLQRDDS